ncbi:large conductance mechanosensitive channel protein MscL [Periweissella beninensis]|uniref:Large-conductance mechanosensitive channel n=1 Tax=Periweissella beninensis TaxID=504936 RepID=A0ABT0VGP7_9LACO|nr:large conductance mechanosensitive channel protein MscL [Periweissella beninensis]MBM7544784.1 large conductance mechanosensitive channel [Periweissella beninensis]MCM2437022.1 large conductance mechanosensitive channel protein MscL [Periweissella beninensis]MCT4395814.1 large conductance mechanosensitive channel protein MscL [Periweissella beninensis]
MLEEFKTFLLRGNILDLSIGVIIGSALTAVVKALSVGLIMPLVNLFMFKIDLSALTYTFGKVSFKFGLVLQALISFIITGFVLFMIVKAVNKFFRKQAPEEAVVQNVELETLQEIRDLLKNK